MPAAAEPLLMTVEQYHQLPERTDVRQELHWGQVVTLTFPKKRRTKLQSRLVELLSPKMQALGLVAAEFPFRALPEYDLRAADVAFVTRARWDATDDDDNLHGAPELVIEVLSPSNTTAGLREKAALCLSNGAEEFWVVDPKRQTVSVTRRHGESRLYQSGDRIPLLLSEGEVEVAEIFTRGGS
jgi:Uma2 family endonuclease